MKFHAGVKRCDKKVWEATKDGFWRPLKMKKTPKTDPDEPNMRRRYVACETKILPKGPGATHAIHLRDLQYVEKLRASSQDHFSMFGIFPKISCASLCTWGIEILFHVPEHSKFNAIRSRYLLDLWIPRSSGPFINFGEFFKRMVCFSWDLGRWNSSPRAFGQDFNFTLYISCHIWLNLDQFMAYSLSSTAFQTHLRSPPKIFHHFFRYQRGVSQ